MAIAHVSGTSTGGAHNGTSIALTVTAAVGTTIVIMFACTTGATGISAISDGHNVYTKGPTQTTNVRNEIWYAFNIGTALTAGTVTITYAAAEAAACAEVYSGVAGIGNTGTNSGSSTAPAVTVTTQDVDNVVAMCGGDTALTSTSAWSATAPNEVWHSQSSLSSTGGAISAASLDAGISKTVGASTVTGTLSVSETWGAVGLELRSIISFPGELSAMGCGSS